MLKRLIIISSLLVSSACGGCGDDPEDPIQKIDLGTPDVEVDMTMTEDMGTDVTVEEDMQADVPVEEDMGSDMTGDAETDDTGGDMGGMLDPFLICQADCNYMGPQADMMDCDFDGLSQTEETSLGTDPCDNDTDGDGLNDLGELQAGTDPLTADSDGDGLDDSDELFFGFNPNNPDSLGDMILDGDRWIVSACDEPITSEPVDYYLSGKGDWQVALPPAFNNYSELTIATAQPADKIAAAVFDDPANEVAASILSDSPNVAQTSPVDVLLDLRSSIGGQFAVQQESTGGEFSTHDFNQAAIGRYLLRTSQVASARQVRDQILFALAPFGAADVTGLPNSAGNTYQDFRVFISVSYRVDTVAGDRLIISVAVAPSEKFDTRDKVQFRMDDLTNSTNVSQADDERLTQCVTFRAGEGNPEADFYWVLDQSGSMSVEYQNVKGVANQFFTNLQNTGLDYRIAVGHMDQSFGGKPRASAGWFTDLATFIGELDFICGFGCGGGSNGLNGGEEFGLKAAKDGIEFMRSSMAPQSLRIRATAQLITILMSDEAPESIEDVGYINSAAGQQLYNTYEQFFVANSIVFSIIALDSSCWFSANEVDQGYERIALATGGGVANLCSSDIGETIDDIIFAATGLASNYRINNTPISSTLRVFKNGEWVPRSRANGFDYFAQTNSIAFFGTYRPVPADPNEGRYGDDIAVSYQTFRNTTK